MNRIRKLTGITFLSILFFFSISFVTFLCQINPLHYYKENENYKLEIGFPFKYYYQFFVNDNKIPNSGWIGKNLIYDCLLTWIFIAGIYYIIKKIKK